MESSPPAKSWMLGGPYFLALSKQQVLEQGVNSNAFSEALHSLYIICMGVTSTKLAMIHTFVMCFYYKYDMIEDEKMEI